ncbi:hypothetical protein LENED_003443 [Lentinula edodes]|uniref:Uncharacterized protein n=1 Tax=Lentinula edodes TaxID=5353 RepID=A0A1Q3E3I8_LENED|nr:hypothetical protein LENED_003443 [Lentinula edodes]
MHNRIITILIEVYNNIQLKIRGATAAIPCDTLGSPRGVALLRPLAPFTWAFICIIDAAPQDNRNLYIEISHDKYCDFCSTSCGAPLNGDWMRLSDPEHGFASSVPLLWSIAYVTIRFDIVPTLHLQR